MPSSGATSAGFCPSTSVCHSTSLPALGQRRERAGGGGVLEALDGGVAERHAGVERLEVVGGVQPGAGADLVDVQPAYGGEQVGAEREVRAAAALEHESTFANASETRSSASERLRASRRAASTCG